MKDHIEHIPGYAGHCPRRLHSSITPRITHKNYTDDDYIVGYKGNVFPTKAENIYEKTTRNEIRQLRQIQANYIKKEGQSVQDQNKRSIFLGWDRPKSTEKPITINQETYIDPSKMANKNSMVQWEQAGLFKRRKVTNPEKDNILANELHSRIIKDHNKEQPIAVNKYLKEKTIDQDD